MVVVAVSVIVVLVVVVEVKVPVVVVVVVEDDVGTPQVPHNLGQSSWILLPTIAFTQNCTE